MLASVRGTGTNAAAATTNTIAAATVLVIQRQLEGSLKTVTLHAKQQANIPAVHKV